MTAFQNIDFHDATLLGVSVSWAALEVQVEVEPCYMESVGPPIIRLRWTGCSRVVIPQEAPWGQLVSINAHGCEGRRFWIEMQSGDSIEIWADGFAVE